MIQPWFSRTSAIKVCYLVAGAASAIALAACGESTTTVTQTQPVAAAQQQTVTQIVKTVTQSEVAAPSPQASSDSGNSGTASADGGQDVPSDLVGKKLDDTEEELDNMGIQYSVDSGGHLVILRGDWGVCSTTPGATQGIDGAVVLHVGHFSCGA